MNDRPDVEAAYRLDGPEANQKLYADWAATYDETFAAESDYLLHAHVANLFTHAGGKGPILDVGAGTGLCAEVLALHNRSPIDATDISNDMLDIARAKGLYRKLIQGDILAGLPIADRRYAGAVSSGTFTTGHVGPDGLDEVLRVTRSGGLLVISVNAKHFEAAGFAAKFDQLKGAIRDLELIPVSIYGPDASGPHAGDKGLVARFIKV